MASMAGCTEQQWRLLMRKFIVVVLVTTLTVCMSIHARSHQAPGKLPFENDQLRAVEYIIQAGAKLSLQSNAPSLFFAVNPFEATLTFKDGHSVPASFQVDDPRWYENPIIAVANTGKSEARFLTIELKKPAPTSHADVPADDGIKSAPDVYKLLYENDRVRVIRVGSKPGQKTPMHSHQGPAFRYAMANTKGRLTMPDGTIREIENKAGETRWIELPTRHILENIGSTEGHTLLVEIK
jgi:quercetin dioxygenase-like cupin family protein